ncbi:hypothetical protein [Roseobacter litoralis]|uniref:hypothetical protein n=1 Tax=Roseobacter litoralis TaxID=42443 RepID=UPI002493A97E|nr:hypothetical protein [Roseobacter litoralis]
MSNQPIAIAAGGMVIGVLLAVAISGSRVDTKISGALERAEGTTSSAVTDATEAMSAQLAELEARLSDGAAAASEEAEARLAALEESFGAQLAALSETAAAQAGAFEAALADLAAAAVAPVAAPEAETQMPSLNAIGVGQTAVFAEGAVRAFVSSFDAEANSAKLSVNGEMVTLDAGASTSISLESGDCAVSVVGVSDAGVEVGSDCGMSEMAAADAPPAPEEGYTPGSVALLSDGALRVFVSSLAQDGKSARIAVNGIDTQVVNSGASIEVAAGDQTCNVTVTGVGNGMVGLEGACN